MKWLIGLGLLVIGLFILGMLFAVSPEGGPVWADNDATDDAGDHDGDDWVRSAFLRGSLEPVSNATWQSECGECHTLYHPGLLPARSWSAILRQLDQHFGEYASLEPGVRREIAVFLERHAADRASARRSRRIAATIAPSEVPLRITQTRYFRYKHNELDTRIFRRKAIGSAANCSACHPGAEQGDFSEERIQIPKSP